MELEILIDVMTNPQVIGVSLVFFPVYIFLIVKESYRYIGLGILLFFSTCAPALDYYGEWLRPPFPFDMLVRSGRPVTLVLLFVTIALMFIAAKNRESIVPVPRTALSVLFLQLALCLRLATGGAIVEAGSRALVFLAVFTLFAMIICREIASTAALRDLCRAVACGFSLYIWATMCFMLVGYYGGFENGRWFGLTGNANHNAMVIALMLPAVLGLVFSGIETKTMKVFYLMTSGVSMLPLMLSGSRGGALTLLVGVAVLFRLKLGKFLLMLIPLAISILAVMRYMGAENEETFSRFRFGGTNTRKYVWQNMIDEWLQNPLFGTPGSFGVAENAYLGVLQRLGLVGLFIQLFVLFVVFKAVAVGLKRRSYMGHAGMYFDISFAGLSAIAANSMFEATFFSNLNQTIFVFYIYLVLLAATSYSSIVLESQTLLHAQVRKP